MNSTKTPTTSPNLSSERARPAAPRTRLSWGANPAPQDGAAQGGAGAKPLPCARHVVRGPQPRAISRRPQGKPGGCVRARARPRRWDGQQPSPTLARGHETPARAKPGTSPEGSPLPPRCPRRRTAGPTPSGRRVRERAALTKAAAAAAPSCRGAWTPGRSKGRGAAGTPAQPCPRRPRPGHLPRTQAPHRARQKRAKRARHGAASLSGENGPPDSPLGSGLSPTARRPRFLVPWRLHRVGTEPSS